MSDHNTTCEGTACECYPLCALHFHYTVVCSKKRRRACYSFSAFTRLPTTSSAKAPPKRVAARTSCVTVRNKFWSGMNSSAAAREWRGAGARGVNHW